MKQLRHKISVSRQLRCSVAFNIDRLGACNAYKQIQQIV